MRRYIITGAPGAGKTTILAALRERGHPVIGEAATDVIAEEQAAGVDAPWLDPGFLDRIVLRQRERQQEPVPAALQVFDRSPVCTLALGRYLDLPVTPALAAEVERMLKERIYQPRVFLVHLLGFVTPTAARRISYEQAIRFERFHVQAYRESGFELVDVPAAPLRERADLVDQLIRTCEAGAQEDQGRRESAPAEVAGSADRR